MKTFCIILGTLNSLGGVEREGLACIEALKEQGFRVILGAMEKTEWHKIEEMFGDVRYKPDKEYSLRLFKTKKFESYQRLFAEFSLNRLKNNFDVIVNIHADLIPIRADMAFAQDPDIIKTLNTANILRRYRYSTVKATYFSIYSNLHNRIVKRSLLKSKILISNSSYAKEALREWIGRESKIIHPPVDIEKYLCHNHDEERENIIVSCGRFSPEKNQRIIPFIASKVTGAKFFIIGSIPTTGLFRKTCLEVIEQIREDTKKLGANNITILQDLPLAEQLKLYKKAKIFFHTALNEHFGMAVVEGMAGGLVPIVYKHGGPWQDILMQGKYGLGYLNIDEAVDRIKRVISDEAIRRELSYLAIQRAKDFSKENFKSRIIEEIEQL